MNTQLNPQRRRAMISLAIMLAGIIIVFLPWIIGLDGFGGGFALACLGGFIAILGIIAAVLYFKLAKSLDHITHPENLIAHWKYSPAEWSRYTESEHIEDSTSRRNLFLLVAVISVVVGLIFWALVRENPAIIALIVLGIVSVTGLAAWLSGAASYRRNKQNPCEVFITREGAYLNRQLHLWKGVGNQLEDVTLESRPGALSLIRVMYSAPSNHGRNTYTARIPVPPGQEEAARRIIQQIMSAHPPESNRL